MEWKEAPAEKYEEIQEAQEQGLAQAHVYVQD